MKRISAMIGPVIIVTCLLLSACSSVRPLQKGETLRCPSCGAEFTIEQGQKSMHQMH